jgi:tungstate transport system substrate-binding protein
MQNIASSGSSFVSRGDNSGTNQLELKLWEAAALEPQGQTWYIESGTGMGQTLQIASEREAYTLVDRATFLSWQDRIDLAIVSEGDLALRNIYHVIRVNPDRYSRVNSAGARAFMDFLLAADTQTLIGEFGRDAYDQSLFMPCARNSCGLPNNGD